MRREPWDWPPEPRRRGRRQARPLQGEILTPEPEPSPRIRVEVTHRYQPRQRQHVPPWLIVLAIVAVLMWMAPLGTIILIVIGSIFVAEHPMIGITFGVIVAVLTIAAIRARLSGNPF